MRGVAPHWRLLVWLVYFSTWTTALIMPVPDTGDWTVEELSIDLKFLFAKSVHISAYAFLAILTGWLRAPARYRWLLMLLLMAHGTVTELVQLNFSYRSGELKDVGFDNVGVLLGALLSWRWWTEP